MAAQTRSFNIPPGQLGRALVAYGEQADMTVGITDAELAARHSPGARGRLLSREALRRILKGTGAAFIQIDAVTIRIVRKPANKVPLPAPAPSATPQVVESPLIIVTASKQKVPLANYPGTAIVLDLDGNDLARDAPQGSAALVSRLPILSSTNLGPGRNKLFLRGIADSSFNGATPATVGQYLGDVRLTYNAPDPNLNLYDMSGVEILVGPQGTLYGTGALGGIIRLSPSPPDLAADSASMSIGGKSVAHGSQGYDAAGMANIVIVPDTLALRGVAYSSLDPGYIDDPSRGLADINRTKSRGGRVALLLNPGDGWAVTLGGALQNIATRDGQYVLRGGHGLERHNLLAQPFDNDYSLAYLTVNRSIGSSDLTSTTSIVRHDIDSTFDATLEGGRPRLFEESLEIRLLSHETRLSGESDSGSWIIGLSGLVARNRTTRMLGDPDNPQPITGVRNVNTEAALFGQYSHRLGGGLTMTLGARLSYAHGTGGLLDEIGENSDDPRRTQFRISPTAALTWQINDQLMAYLRAQSAFRPGLLEVSSDPASSEARQLDPDTLSMIEAGFRHGTDGHDPLTVGASISAARWVDIQSDLIDGAGLPFTANVGDGRIVTFELQAGWRPTPPLVVEASVFLNKSKLTNPSATLIAGDDAELPNIPHMVARLSASYRHRLDQRTDLSLSGAVRYVGSSDLGVGELLDVNQGDYVESSLGARLARGPIAVSIDIGNVADSRGNRFSFGNPFGIEQRNQITPLVPRSIRLGMDFRF